MLSRIGISRVTGLLLIALIPALILSTSVIDSLDTYERDFREAFEGIADDPVQIRIGVAFTIAASLLSVALAGALYLRLSPHHKALALFGALGFLVTGVLLMLAGIWGIALDRMAGEFDKAHDLSRATSLTDSAQPLAFMIESAIFPALLVTLPLSLIVFGSLIARAGGAPRWLGWMGVTFSSIMTLSVLLAWLIDAFWFIGMIAGIGVLGWFAITGVWMLLWGTRDVAVSSPSRVPVRQPEPAL